jgi:hypothetical protein
MITDAFLTDVLAHIGTLRDLLGRVKTLYDKGHPTYKEIEDFEKGCDTTSAWLGAWLTIRAEISKYPPPPHAGAKRKTGRINTTDTGKRERAPVGRMPQGDGDVEMIPQKADITTLLRQMRQLCV